MNNKNREVLSRKLFFTEFVNQFSRELKSDTKQMDDRFQSLTIPPGSKSVEDYIGKCNKCYDCVSVCPHSSIRVKHDDNDKLSGYPIIEPRIEPCYYCEELHCIASCKTGALTNEFQNAIIAELVIDKNTCHSFNERLCYTCVTNCPESGKAIAMNSNGNPKINNDLCTGCGICIQVCPVEESSIKIKSYWKE